VELMIKSRIIIVLLFYVLKLENLFAQVSLSVNAIPRRVEVIMDGVSLGETPIRDFEISSGPHDFILTKRGYASVDYSLIVNQSKSIKLDFFLNPIYKIKFTTEEKGLTFELNNNHQWTDKKIRLQLEAGDHLLRVYKRNKIVDEQTITADEPKHFKYFFKKKLSK